MFAFDVDRFLSGSVFFELHRTLFISFIPSLAFHSVLQKPPSFLAGRPPDVCLSHSALHAMI
jgi:hypothetical protein